MLSRLTNSTTKSSQNDSQTLQARAPVSGEPSWQTRFKQAACLSLLASPFAAAARPDETFGAKASRHLLDTSTLCANNGGYFGPYAGTLNATADVFNSTTAAVLSPNVWGQVACVDGQLIPSVLNNNSIPVTFTDGPIDSNVRQAVLGDFGRVSETAGIRLEYVSVEAGVTPQPNIIFNGEIGEGHKPWETTGLAVPIDANYQSFVVISAYDQDNQDQAWRLSTVAQAMGLKGRFDPGLNGIWNYDLGAFANDTLSSVTFAATAPCANVTRLGALDLRALVDVYGYASGTDENAVITVDDIFGAGGVIASSGTNNTLRATTSSNFGVQVYMGDDGLHDTIVGQSVARLAPGSVITNADISGTNGGIIIGNNQTANFMIGSPHNDTFVVGKSAADITLNGGHDIVVLPYNSSLAYVEDMNNDSSIWIVPTATSSAPKIAAWGTGSSVISHGGPSVFLYTILPTEVAPLVHYATPMGTNQSSPTQVATCASDLLALNISSGSNGGGFDPCAHIGDNGFGGAGGACAAGLGL